MKRPDNLKKPLFVLLLILLCVSLLSVGTYAAYTTSSYAKQVVRARTQDGNENLRFSSNLLYSYDLAMEEYGERSISVSNVGKVVIGIAVCNYPQGLPASFNDKDISYTMSVTAVGADLTFEPQTGSLQGGKPSSVSHTIEIPADYVPTVSSGYLKVVVTPDEASKEATMEKKLAANLKIIPQEAAASAWQGALQFEGDSDKNAAINYYIHGTEECDMILTWGPNIVLGQWSRESLGVVSGTESNSVTIHVGGPGQPTSYYLQFYRIAPAQKNETAESLGISFYKQT